MNRTRLLAAAFAVLLAVPALPGGGSVAAAQDGADVTFDYDGDALTLEAGPGQAVRGGTDLPAGTTLTVHLRATGENPFLVPAETTVDSDGRFRAVFDLSDVAPGTTFQAAVRHDGSDLATADGEAVECPSPCGGDAGNASAANATLGPDDGGLELGAGPGRAVRGETDLPAGTTLSVRMQSTGENPFLRTTETTVDGDGRFRATFGLSDVAAGTSVTAVVHHDGTRLARANGTVVECVTDCTPPSGDDGRPAANRSTVSGDELALQSVVAVDRGETARIAVGLGDADAATLSVGGPSVNFVSNVTVRDGDGDGVVTVLFDTAAAGSSARTAMPASREDTARVPDGGETRLENPLAAGEYSTTLYRGADAGGDEAGVGTLVVRDAGRPAGEDGDATTTPWTGAEFGFEHAVVSGRQGEVVRVPVGLADANAATVAIGGPDVGWQVEATVRDGDDADSAVVLLFDTANAGDPADALSVVDAADELSVESGAELDAGNGTVATGDYPLAVYRGTDADGSREDIATLVVERGFTTGTVEDPADGTADASLPLGTYGLLGAGGLLAVGAIALLLGVFRS